ncbi:Murein hydrolase activator NlpD precursor [Fusobacterium necrogenes]|uniref:Murein hydrolase activator NlpD n=1 Tax=Fusobacterium necrogenes TaxID=858 RepID=A0A377GUR3_9FUSO|nr:M23 family metallopeptidase [Fusobacterium necrogenes]STO30725.1 Murein hydrolase activator NlpD precursor [Fusobacterium necrogenes]
MKGKISLLVVLIITFYIGILVGTPFKAEVVDLKQFTDYYEEGAAENGGWEVQKDNFYTFSREYSLIGEEGGGVQELPKIDENDIPEKKTYIVQKGDTLSEIAEAYNMGLSVLMANNPGVSASNLRVGQEITVLTGNGIFYKVSKGDSLSKIAELFKVDVEEIKKINKLDSNMVQLGDVLYIKNPNVTKYLGSRSPNIDNRSNLGFIMPIKYTGITSPYGNRFHPVLKRYIFHAGADLRARFIPLYASKEGKVTFAGSMNGYGKIIIIQHSGGYETRYAHLDKIGVRKGQYVKTGELIGKTGQSGRVTGPHLHFELRKNGKTLNPMRYMPK